MFSPESIIKTYRLTEKTTALTEDINQYTFEVYPDANRREVAAAIERMYPVKVARVNILNKQGKLKRSRTIRGHSHRTAAMKKAIVTLVPGDAIDLA